jgi:hypothetical protein
MKKALSLTLVFLSLLPGIAAAGQTGDFKPVLLSPRGRIAYQRLRSACIFSIGRVGFGGDISQAEVALYQLLEEREAIEALKSLVMAGSYEGGLYGLLGLRLIRIEEFNRAVEIYNARHELPEWQTTGSFECFRASGDTVTTMNGCIMSTEPREKVVISIQSGHYESQLGPTVGSPESFFRLRHNKALQLTAR